MNENVSINLTPEQDEQLDFYLWVSEMEAMYGNIYR